MCNVSHVGVAVMFFYIGPSRDSTSKNNQFFSITASVRKWKNFELIHKSVKYGKRRKMNIKKNTNTEKYILGLCTNEESSLCDQ